MKHLINRDIRTEVERLRVCLRRIEQDLAAGNRWQVLSGLLELGELSNRTYHLLNCEEKPAPPHQKQD